MIKRVALIILLCIVCYAINVILQISVSYFITDHFVVSSAIGRLLIKIEPIMILFITYFISGALIKHLQVAKKWMLFFWISTTPLPNSLALIMPAFIALKT